MLVNLIRESENSWQVLKYSDLVYRTDIYIYAKFHNIRYPYKLFIATGQIATLGMYLVCNFCSFFGLADSTVLKVALPIIISIVLVLLIMVATVMAIVYLLRKKKKSRQDNDLVDNQAYGHAPNYNGEQMQDTVHNPAYGNVPRSQPADPDPQEDEEGYVCVIWQAS